MLLPLLLVLFLLGSWGAVTFARNTVSNERRAVFAAIATVSLLGLVIGTLAFYIAATEVAPDDAGSRGMGFLFWQFLQLSLPLAVLLWMLGYGTRYYNWLSWTPAGLCLLLLVSGALGLIVGGSHTNRLFGQAVAYGVLLAPPTTLWTWLMRKA